MRSKDIVTLSLDRPRSALCPLFRPCRGSIEQFASGVLIKIGPARFLITVAHATDESDIRIPGKRGFVQLAGHFVCTKLPASGTRADDSRDIAFVRLDDSLESDIHDALLFLGADEADVNDVMSERDSYSVIGFPARRSSASEGVVSTRLLTCTGTGVGRSCYEKLEFSPGDHVLVRFRRKRAHDFSLRRRMITCLPEGMSGGGIFSWSKKLPDLAHVAQPRLIGVVHSYHASDCVFVGTRLQHYIGCIRVHHPNLPIVVGRS
jgi:hypothetical protein